jgi:hypothetical protein
LARVVGHIKLNAAIDLASDIQADMSEEEVTMESLTKVQKKLEEENIANFEKLCLNSFIVTLQGQIQKMLSVFFCQAHQGIPPIL